MDGRSRTIGKVFLGIYFAVILYLCLGSFQGVSGLWKTLWGIQLDKVVHFLMYLPFPALALWAFYDGKHFGRTLLLILLAGFLFGAGIEVMQALLTDARSAEWGDLGANTLGLLLSGAVISVIHKCFQR